MDNSLFILAQALIFIVHFLAAPSVARNKDFIRALSLGNIALPFGAFLYYRFGFCMILVVYVIFLTLSEKEKNGDISGFYGFGKYVKPGNRENRCLQNPAVFIFVSTLSQNLDVSFSPIGCIGEQ